MLEQRLAAELGEHVDRVDSGVDEIAEDKVDYPVYASEGNRRLGAFPSEGKEPSSLAAGKYDAQHADVQGSFHGEDGFLFGDLRQSVLLKQLSYTILSEPNLVGAKIGHWRSENLEPRNPHS
jgi:hypothetical protein